MSVTDRSDLSDESLSDQYGEAFQMAFRLHRFQKRKATSVPYIAHLMSVSALVLEFGGSEVEATAALLHDAVEDQGGEAVLAQIETQFGAEVARIVWECSDASEIPKPPWKDRKMQYIQHLETADSSVLLVSLADKLHNLRDILITYRREGSKTWQRFKGGKAGTLWYYGRLLEIFSARGQADMAAEMERVYDSLCELVRQDGGEQKI